MISYVAPNGAGCSETGDFVNYVDSKGRERKNVPLNYYWDFEEVEEVLNTDIDWEQIRIKAAISALQGFAATPDRASAKELALWSVCAADALIAELKKGGEK